MNIVPAVQAVLDFLGRTNFRLGFLPAHIPALTLLMTRIAPLARLKYVKSLPQSGTQFPTIQYFLANLLDGLR